LYLFSALVGLGAAGMCILEVYLMCYKNLFVNIIIIKHRHI